MLPEDLTKLRTLGFVVAGSLFWLEYWDLKDRARPEPRMKLVLAFLAGVGAAALGLAVYWAIEQLGVSLQPCSDPARELRVCVGVVGPVEEGLKFLVARTIVFRWKAFDERVDGFVYAAAVGLGFAALENFTYLPAIPGWGGQLVRTLCSPLVHTLFAAIWGWGTAHALLVEKTPGRRFLWQAGSLVLAAIAHGLYDFALAAGAPSGAVAAIVFALWALAIVGARRALRHDDRDAAAAAARSTGDAGSGRSPDIGYDRD